MMTKEMHSRFTEVYDAERGTRTPVRHIGNYTIMHILCCLTTYCLTAVLMWRARHVGIYGMVLTLLCLTFYTWTKVTQWRADTRSRCTVC